MGTRRESATANNRNVNPEVEGTYHAHHKVKGTGDPNKTDSINKDGIGKNLVKFIDHDEGFLKVRRALDSADLHLTWTWSVGKHAGRYVYVRVFAWQVAYGLELLLEKVADVEVGLRIATPDKMTNRP